MTLFSSTQPSPPAASTCRCSLGAGETVAVLGPNGAGKSTLLSIIAGLLRPDAGRAELDGDRVLFDLGAGRAHLDAPPHPRGTALLAQEPLLFPHLSALDNVAFGPRSAGASSAAARETARHWLAEVDAAALADRRPGQLSGGQAQRVAVARALAADPELLLLDEPMAALDIHAAPLLRRLLKRVLAGRTGDHRHPRRPRRPHARRPGDRPRGRPDHRDRAHPRSPRKDRAAGSPPGWPG